MKRINSFAILFMIFTSSFIGAKMKDNTRIYTSHDLEIKLSAEYRKETVVLKMKITNLSYDTIKIPAFLFPSDKGTIFGDWFEITNNNGDSINYEGIQADIDYDEENVNCLVLNSRQKHIITFSHLTKYYNLMKGGTYTISYIGPLGESNTVKLKIKKITTSSVFPSS